jgi:hypothetical protein
MQVEEEEKVNVMVSNMSFVFITGLASVLYHFKYILLDITVKPLSIVFQGTGNFERYIREMIVPGNH